MSISLCPQLAHGCLFVAHRGIHATLLYFLAFYSHYKFLQLLYCHLIANHNLFIILRATTHQSKLLTLDHFDLERVKVNLWGHSYLQLVNFRFGQAVKVRFAHDSVNEFIFSFVSAHVTCQQVFFRVCANFRLTVESKLSCPSSVASFLITILISLISLNFVQHQTH